jgi:DDE family transposase
LAYNLGNFLRRLALPKGVRHRSLTTLREKLIKIGAKVTRHAKYVTFQLAEAAVTRDLFAAILDRIARLAIPPPLVAGRPATSGCGGQKCDKPRRKSAPTLCQALENGPNGPFPRPRNHPHRARADEMSKLSGRARRGGRVVRMVTIARLDRLQAQPLWEMSG